IAADYYVNAGIPTSSYRIGTINDLDECTDLFVMPHADPTWETHSPLIDFNEQGGYIWAACHAVSVLENVDDPNDPDIDPDLNFLSTNGLIDFGDHGDGTPLYDYNAALGSDPIMQFIGRIDEATLNGSEQVYLPAPGSAWRPTTSLLVYDGDNPEVAFGESPGEAAVMAYGRGFGDPDNGLVMYEGGHSHDGGDPDNIAAQRAFFNLHLLSGIERGIDVEVTTPPIIEAGETVTVSATIHDGSYNYAWTWEAACGGTFAEPTGAGTGDGLVVTTTYTAPADGSSCAIKLFVEDTCERSGVQGKPVTIVERADLDITKADSVDPVLAGTEFTYTLLVTNLGPSDATNVAVSDPLPAEVAFLSATTTQGACSLLASGVECDVGDLAIGESATIDITAQVDVETFALISNTATVSALQIDPDPSNNTATEDTQATFDKLRIVKTATPDFIGEQEAPADVTYTFDVTNEGPLPVTNVAVNDSQCAPQPVLVGGFNVGDSDQDRELDPGETWRFACVVSGIAADVTNIATATADDPLLGSIASPPDTAFVNVIAPAISITKNPAIQNVPAGGEAVFSITVVNIGDIDLTKVIVSDPPAPRCDRYLGALAAGQSITYSCSLTVTNPTPFTGTNVVDVSGTAPDGTVVTDSDSADYTVVTSDLVVDKANDATGPLYPGDFVTYSIEVENIGTGTHNDVTVSDLLPDGFNWVSTKVDAPVPIIEEDWHGEVKERYPNGWLEWNDDSKPASGDVNVTDLTGGGCGIGENCALRLDHDNSGLYRSIDLSGTDTVTVDFDWATLKSDNNPGPGRFALAVWNGTAWQPVESFTLNATFPTGFTARSVTFDPATYGGKIAAGRVGFITNIANSGNDEVLIDNIDLTWASGSTLLGALAEDFSAHANDPKAYENGWVEINDNNDRFGGDVQSVDGTTATTTCQINANCVLMIDDKDNGIYYGTDLSSYTSVTVTFDYRVVQVDNLGSNFRLVYWDGLAYRTIATYPIAGGSSSYSTFAVTLDAATSPNAFRSNARIGFLTAASPNGGNDRIHIDNVTITANRAFNGGPPPNLVTTADDVDLGPGGTITVTVVAQVDPTLTPFYPLEQVNTVAASSVEQPFPVQASSQVDVIVGGVDIDKTAEPEFVGPGDPVTYRMTVVNTGNVPLANVVVTDPSCSPVTFTDGDTNLDGFLDLTEAWTYTCITASPPITNTATVTAEDANFVAVASASDDATVEVIISDIAVVKTPSAVIVRPDDPVIYTYEVTTGSLAEPLIAVFVEDDLCAPVTPAMVGSFNAGDTSTDGVLDADETWFFTCTAVLTA
ncbi:MAG: hypothetical protein OEO77_12450, partial [Acidimicrobiia bacterium]|nr:hypothetical protein [Acidimicrobiia bacterium]